MSERVMRMHDYRERVVRQLRAIELGDGSHENLSKIASAFMTPSFGWSRNECENLQMLLVELIDIDAMMPCPLDADGVPIRLGDRVTRTYDDRDVPLRVAVIQHGSSDDIIAEVVGGITAYTVPSNELRHVTVDTPDAILDDRKNTQAPALT